MYLRQAHQRIAIAQLAKQLGQTSAGVREGRAFGHAMDARWRARPVQSDDQFGPRFFLVGSWRRRAIDRWTLDDRGSITRIIAVSAARTGSFATRGSFPYARIVIDTKPRQPATVLGASSS